MKRMILGFSAFVLASAILVSLMFSGIVTGPAVQPPVQFDVNVKNTPLPVEVTNPSSMPIAAQCSFVFDQGHGEGTDLGRDVLVKTLFVPVDDKTVILTGGSVSGELVFTSDNGAGFVPATAGVFLTTSDGSGPRFALPFNSICRVENVTWIEVAVHVYRPALTGSANYGFEMMASVFWYIEE